MLYLAFSKLTAILFSLPLPLPVPSSLIF